MRWIRLFLLGLASVYPLYWTAQFTLFFLPAALRAIFLREPLAVVSVSFLQVTAISGKADGSWGSLEALLIALILSLAIWCLRGDRFLEGGLAIVILGQAAILPFLSQMFLQSDFSALSVVSILFAVAIIGFGLYRITSQIGAGDFIDRLALLSLFAVLPQALLWFVLRLYYPFFGTRFLLMLLAPVYVGAVMVSAVSIRRKRNPVRSVRPSISFGEILTSLAATCLLLTAIGLTSRSQTRSPQNSAKSDWQVHPS